MHFISHTRSTNVSLKRIKDIQEKRANSKNNISEELFLEWKDFITELQAPKNAHDSLEALSSSSAFCIVSGQQVGIALSPILSLFKLISTEALSEIIEEQTSTRVIPIFWLQTEDHDLKEIAESSVFDSFNSIKKFDLLGTKDIDSNRISVGSLKTPSGIEHKLNDIFQIIDPASLASDLQDKIKTSLKEGTTLGSAFAKVFYGLFPNSRTIFFDPRLPAAKNATKEIYRKILNDHDSIYNQLKQYSDLLRRSGRTTPIKLKSDSPLFFYHPKGEDSERYRLRWNNNKWVIEETGASITEEELENEITTSPQKFSSSALLRPLIQDYLLPTIAYIGGSTELEYLEQASPLYNHFSIEKPFWVKRASGLFLSDKIFPFFINLDLDTSQIFELPPEKLKTIMRDKLIESLGDSNNIKAELEVPLKEIQSLLQNRPLSLDPTLSKPFEKTIKGINEHIDKYLGKYEQSILNAEEVSINRLEKLLSMVYPEGVFQERKISGIWPFFKCGENIRDEMMSSIKESYSRSITFDSNQA